MTGKSDIVFRVFLILAIVTINVLPFSVRHSTDYTFVFAISSMIHAELAVFAALLIFFRYSWTGVLWFVLGIGYTVIAMTRLLPGQYARSELLKAFALGAIAVLPALIPILLVFFMARCKTPTSHLKQKTNSEGKRFALVQLFELTAGFALLAMMLGRFLTEQMGWLSSPRAVLEFGVPYSLILGLLVGPLAVITLRPGGWKLAAWALYFLAICFVTPFIEMAFDPRATIEWTDETFPLLLRIWLQNITWYAPQVIPTAAMIGLLRLGMKSH